MGRDEDWRQEQHETQAAQWDRLREAEGLAAQAAGEHHFRDTDADWAHEMIDEPDLSFEAGEIPVEPWRDQYVTGRAETLDFTRDEIRLRVLPGPGSSAALWRDHGGRATGYPGAVKRPWIDGPTVAALMMLGIVLAPVAALVAWLARRLKVVRR